MFNFTKEGFQIPILKDILSNHIQDRTQITTFPKECLQWEEKHCKHVLFRSTLLRNWLKQTEKSSLKLITFIKNFLFNLHQRQSHHEDCHTMLLAVFGLIRKPQCNPHRIEKNASINGDKLTPLRLVRSKHVCCETNQLTYQEVMRCLKINTTNLHRQYQLKGIFYAEIVSETKQHVKLIPKTILQRWTMQDPQRREMNVSKSVELKVAACVLCAHSTKHIWPLVT